MSNKINPVNATLTQGLNLQGREDVVFPANVLEQARQGGKDTLLRASIESAFDSTAAAKESRMHRRGEAVPVVHVDTFGYTTENAAQMPLLGGVTVELSAPDLQPSSVNLIKAAVVLKERDAIEALRDVVSHYEAWRSALTILRDDAQRVCNRADETYYQHELNVLERVHAGLRNIPLPAWKPIA